MKAATVKELKIELNNRSSVELVEIILRLSKFKKENKELLSYLLFESVDEEIYIENVKKEIDTQFEQLNKLNYYFVKKSVRKILRSAKTYIRYSNIKTTEIELLLYFCLKLDKLEPSIFDNTVLTNIYFRQIELIKRSISLLHEDLRYDYEQELLELLQLEKEH